MGPSDPGEWIILILCITDSEDDISQFDAIQLFVERARAILPTFELTNDNAGVVATLIDDQSRVVTSD